jgi:hypothetical protein
MWTKTTQSSSVAEKAFDKIHHHIKTLKKLKVEDHTST